MDVAPKTGGFRGEAI